LTEPESYRAEDCYTAEPKNLKFRESAELRGRAKQVVMDITEFLINFF
jgi:hypothetical protein